MNTTHKETVDALQTRLDEIQNADGLHRKTRAVANGLGDGRVTIGDGVGWDWTGLPEVALERLVECKHNDYVDFLDGTPDPAASIFEALELGEVSRDE